VTATTIGLFGISMPAFFFGLLLILLCQSGSGSCPWFPTVPLAIVLPAVALGLIEAAPAVAGGEKQH